MRWMNGKEAVQRGAAGNKRMETEDGIIIFPSDLSEQTVRRGTGALPHTGRCARLPEFYPATPAEALGMARSACLYADTYRTPILIRLETEVREGRESLIPETLPKMRRRRNRTRESGRSAPGSERRQASETAAGGRGSEGSAGVPHTVPGLAFSDSAWNRSTGHGDRGIIVRGPAFLRAAEILNGCRDVRILKIGTTWPVPEEKIRDFLSGVREVLVLDETREELLTGVYAVKGKYDLSCRVLSFYGEETRADDIADALKTLLGPEADRFLLNVAPPAERSLYGMPMIPAEAEP